MNTNNDTSIDADSKRIALFVNMVHRTYNEIAEDKRKQAEEARVTNGIVGGVALITGVFLLSAASLVYLIGRDTRR